MRGSKIGAVALLTMLGITTEGALQTVQGQSVAVLKQVNTDGLGNDISGDAANEPSIAVDPTNPNRMAIGWRQFDSVTDNFRQAGVAYTSNGGLSWTPSVLSPGVFGSDPVLAADADGRFYYASINNSSTFAVVTYKSVNGGATWSSPVYAYGGDKEWITVDRTSGPGRGNVYESWTSYYANSPPSSFARSTNGASSFEPPLSTPTSGMHWGTMDVGANGTMYMAGQADSGSGILFAKSTNAQYAAQTPAFSASTSVPLGGDLSYGGAVNPGGLLGQVWIATDHSQSSSRGNIYVLGSVTTGSSPVNVMFTRSSDDGATWSAPVRVNNDPSTDNASHWFGTMSVAPNGRIDAIWNDTRNDPNNLLSQLYYAYSFDAGNTWRGNVPLTVPFNPTVGWPNQNKIGDYYHMVSDDGGANIAFAATFTGGQDVYYMRLQAVPEPGSVILIAIGAVGLLAHIWRQRQRPA